jgi:hypothetical protein
VPDDARSTTVEGGTLVHPTSFEVRVRGTVPDDLLEEFAGMTAVSVPVETVLSGMVADQSALYGVLNRLQSLGLELVEVRRVTEPRSD